MPTHGAICPNFGCSLNSPKETLLELQFEEKKKHNKRVDTTSVDSSFQLSIDIELFPKFRLYFPQLT